MRFDSSIYSRPPVTLTGRRSPRFFKVFLPELSSHRLVSGNPPAFLKHIQGRFPGVWSIVGPSGNAWRLEMVEDGDGKVFFEVGWVEFAKDHSLRVGEFMVFEYLGGRSFSMLLLDYSACEKPEALDARPQGRSNKHDNDLPMVRTSANTSIASGSKFRPTTRGLRVLLSRRRPVTKEEIANAMREANLFKSKKPFFVRSIRKSDIYYFCKMYVPRYFVDKHFPDHSTDLFLKSGNGKLYMVRLYNKRRDVYLTSGWRNFALENNIEEDDACVFELVKENEFRVHIHRVVKQVVPVTSAYINKL